MKETEEEYQNEPQHRLQSFTQKQLMSLFPVKEANKFLVAFQMNWKISVDIQSKTRTFF